MSDYGDFCREQRLFNQDRRSMWAECPHCAKLFGTGTKVAPGMPCKRHRDWIAPGVKGSDLTYARAKEQERDNG